MNKWVVIETPCYPRKWKLVNDKYKESNSCAYYFEDYSKAQKEADTKNEEEKDKI